MKKTELAAVVDHSILAPDATNEDVRRACDLAMEHGCRSVVVHGANVKFASVLVAGTPIKVSAVVGGFPLGRAATSVKEFEAIEAVRLGADELNMVMNIGAFFECSPDYLLKEVRDAVRAAQGRMVRIILETSYLTDQQRLRAALTCVDAGASMVVASTGFASTAVSPQEVAQLSEGLPDTLPVIAAGDFSTLAEVEALMGAGAAGVQTSRTADVLSQTT